MADKDYIAVATKYANDITTNKIPACKLVKLACQRYLNDLADTKSDYYLDAKAAWKICWFVEQCPHVKGPLGGQLIQLEAFQVFILVNAFGWLHKSGKRAGLRRFRFVYLSLPRGAGKTTLSAPVALYMLLTQKDSGAEVYACATSQKQARLAFDVARKMASSLPANMRAKWMVEIMAHSILANEMSSFKPLSYDSSGDAAQGLNISFAILDEFAFWDDRKFYDSLVSGYGKRLESMLWAITTAGYDLTSIGYERQQDVEKILQGVIKDDKIFGIIYTIDEDDDWQDELSLQKANPTWGVSSDEDLLLHSLSEAKQSSSKQSEYKTKHLNIWLNNVSAFFDIPSWKKCQTDLNIDDYEDCEAFIGVDLSATTDMTAMTITFRKDGHYYCFPRYYLPRCAINDGRNAQYKGWAIENRLIATDGNAVDYEVVEQDIYDLCSKYNVKKICFDPWNAMEIQQRLLKAMGGEKVITVGQSIPNLSEATKQLDALTRDVKFHYDCPILLWMASNATASYDRNNNCKINKSDKGSSNKVDGLSALITSLTVMLVTQPKQQKDWSKMLLII